MSPPIIPNLAEASAPLEPLAAFMKRWHRVDLGLATEAFSDPLCWWTDFLQNERELFADSHNHFVSPPESADDHPFLTWSGDQLVESARPDLRVFYVENQGVITWAAAASSPDPLVWARHGDRFGKEGWRREEDRFCRVLLKAVILESMFGASEGGNIDRMPTATWNRIRSRDLERVAFNSHPELWPEFYQGNEYLAAVFGEEGEDIRLMLASSTPGALDFLNDEVENPWDFGL